MMLMQPIFVAWDWLTSDDQLLRLRAGLFISNALVRAATRTCALFWNRASA
jgi:hypothetical protein